MKKSILLLICIIGPLLTAQAQFFRFGGSAGGNISKALGDDASTDVLNHLAGFNGGFIGTYEFVSKLSVQAELQYEQKGLTFNGFPINPDEVLVDDLRLHYITMPLQLKVQKGGLFVLAGPYVGYLVSEESRVRVVDNSTFRDPEPITIREYAVSSNDLESWDYGYTAGLGLELDNGFFMSFHNNGGFKSFSKVFDQRNFTFKVSIGVLIDP